MERTAAVLASTALLVSTAAAQDLSMADIEARITALKPKATDFRFVPPAGWTSVPSARVVSVMPASAQAGSEALADGDGHSVWVAPLAEGAPEAILDFGTRVAFDRFVVFSRHTDARGTAGGNNAVRRIALAVSDTAAGPWTDVADANIDGPAPMCFKKAGGQICVFIDRAEPTVVPIAPVQARAVRVRLEDAHWAAEARPEWKTSVAVSEILVYSSGSVAKR
jgi:hypothetical protein